MSFTEKDSQGDLEWTWVYPSFSTELRQSVMQNCCLSWDAALSVVPFVYTQFCKQWMYLRTEATDKLPKVNVSFITSESLAFYTVVIENYSLL